MRLLLDTQVLVWASFESKRLSAKARTLLADPASVLLFSVASLWEVAIKQSLGRRNFDVDPRVLRRGLSDHGYEELPIRGEHAAAVVDLPAIHRDPFDRMLIAQALVEGITLVTSDATVARYPAPIRKV